MQYREDEVDEHGDVIAEGEDLDDPIVMEVNLDEFYEGIEGKDVTEEQQAQEPNTWQGVQLNRVVEGQSAYPIGERKSEGTRGKAVNIPESV